MAETVRTGSILIKEGTFLDDSLHLETEPYSKGWRLLKKVDSYGVKQKVREAEWTFFLLAGEIKALAFGSDGQKRTRRAANRIMARVGSLKFNCVEITQVVAKRFLGLPYVCVTAHSRHLQEGDILFQAKKRFVPRAAKLAAV